MKFWLLAVGELSVLGLLFCSYSIGSATWSKKASTVVNGTEIGDSQTSLWQLYYCDLYGTYTGVNGGVSVVGTLGQALNLLSLLVAASIVILIPVFLLTETPRHASRILLVFCVFGYLNATLQVAGALTLTSRGDGLTTSANQVLSLLAALLHLVGAILTNLVATTRHFLHKLDTAKKDHKLLRVLAVAGFNVLLLAAVITFAILRSPHWTGNGVVSSDFFVYCVKSEDGFGEKESTMMGVQALMVLGMLLSVVTVSLVTVFFMVKTPSIKSKLIRAVLITCFFGGIIMVIALVIIGASMGTDISFSFVTALLSGLCSLAISGIGVLNKIPAE